MNHFGDLTLATTVHNNAAMSSDMLRSFAENVGTVAETVIVDDASDIAIAATPGAPARVIRTPSALGERQMLPMQTNKMRMPRLLQGSLPVSPIYGLTDLGKNCPQPSPGDPL